ncbi:hypothetical protein Drose_05720 [Dactylosporangium roseum]|uniref:Restriction endonuclease type IV Mrr domain-containing protein n=1 Tax=Dactylosporangium roseum TaxID=47989 RepID=A0ABY5Z9U7_9ACTN|nr:hypothetical protein [Dactylosporangium roseum]UWZ37768.1 hypothetical protein Drose_05720 [Dactylosporangium roseum]
MDMVLFSNLSLDETLRGAARKMVARLENWEANSLLGTPVADVIDELMDIGSVDCPRLHRDQAWQEDPVEDVERRGHHPYRVERRFTKFILVVPFSGNRSVLDLRTSKHTGSYPYVEKMREQEIWVSAVGDGKSASTVEAELNAAVDKVEMYLGWAREEIERHNGQLQAELPEMVERRRAKLLADRNLQAAIGYPIRRRADADTYAVPIQRRAIRPQRGHRQSAAPFVPEPVMAEADYRAALAVLRTSRNGLERSPRLAAKLNEEEIRDFLLFNLNNNFEGAAAGEVFNGDGKTDILIRVEDRNIFIGECKVWKGPKTMDEAFDQLFGYLVWRDTKAAILLFIRSANVTDAIRKAVAKIKAHPNYKRPAPPPAEGEHAFVMHAKDDPEREIHLALLPFALRPPRATT